MAENTSYNSIISDIKCGNIKNLYLFYGPETLLISDVLLRLEKKVLTPAFKSLNYVKLEGANTTYDLLVNACETLPFMDERKLVIVDGCTFFKNSKSKRDDNEGDSQSEELCSYLAKIPATTILILIAGDDVDKRKKLYSCVKKSGYIAEFSPLKNEELIKWVIKEFEKLKKTIGKAEALYFTDRVSGNLGDMLNEINKVCAYAGGANAISKSDIDTVVSKSLELNIFQLVDSISSKNCDRALLILNELLLDSEPVPLILSMIIRQYRLLLNTLLLLRKGYSTAEIADKLKIKTFVATSLMRLSRGLSEREVEKRMEECLCIDMAIKKGKMDQRVALESLIVEFSK